MAFKIVSALGMSLFAAGIAFASPADEKAIRKLYQFRDRCYNRGDIKKLATTELPTYFAVSFAGKTITHQQIADHLVWRFSGQVSSKRVEKPLSFAFRGDEAKVKVLVSDDFIVRDKAKVGTRNVRKEHGIATWRKTPQGWRLEKLQFTKVEWVDEKGKWQYAPKQGVKA